MNGEVVRFCPKKEAGIDILKDTFEKYKKIHKNSKFLGSH